jgi:plasmid replication initiation protein
MRIKSKELVQSYVFTTAKYDFTAYEKRIMYRLVELSQALLEGHTLQGFSIQQTLLDDLKEVTMPLSAFLKDDDDDNYSEVKKALKSLRQKTIEYEDEKMWKVIGIIELPKFFKKGYVRFAIHPEIYQAILSFAKGWRKIELKVAMSLNSRHAMTLYELMSRQKTPLTYKIEDLKSMFKVEGMYAQPADFIKRVIEPAKQELNKKSPYSFTYTKGKEGKKVVKLTFTPKYIPANADPILAKKEAQKSVSIRWDFSPQILDLLKNKIGITEKGIKNNYDTFKEGALWIDDFLGFLTQKAGKARQAKNPIGFVINAIKGEIESAKLNGKGNAQ